jgi:hypothetical protein
MAARLEMGLQSEWIGKVWMLVRVDAGEGGVFSEAIRGLLASLFMAMAIERDSFVLQKQ